MSEYVKELQMHIRDREYKIEKLKEENQKLKEALSVASAEIKDLKTKLEKAEAVISFYANKRHWDYTRIQMVEDMEMHGFGNLGGFRAREYLKGEG